MRISDIITEDTSLGEMLKKVKGRWALVSKSNPDKVLQYYRGPKGQKPSDEWVASVERRVHAFSEEEYKKYISKKIRKNSDANTLFNLGLAEDKTNEKEDRS